DIVKILINNAFIYKLTKWGWDRNLNLLNGLRCLTSTWMAKTDQVSGFVGSFCARFPRALP
ncbi:hypothetical protein BU598_13050, partial [Staphylococcus arlettae]